MGEAVASGAAATLPAATTVTIADSTAISQGDEGIENALELHTSSQSDSKVPVRTEQLRRVPSKAELKAAEKKKRRDQKGDKKLLTALRKQSTSELLDLSSQVGQAVFNRLHSKEKLLPGVRLPTSSA